MTRWRRIVKYLLLLLGMSAALLAACSAVLLTTETGSSILLQLALTRLQDAGGFEISVEESSGTLLQGLSLQGIRYNDAAAQQSLAIRQLAFEWQPWQLWNSQLHLNRLELAGLQWVAQSDPADTSEFNSNSITSWFELLPVTLQIDAAQATELSITTDDNTTLIPRLQFGGSLNQQQLELHDVDVEYAGATVRGQAALQKDLAIAAELLWSYNAQYEFAGNLVLAGNLNTLQLEHDLRSPLQVHSSGSVVTGLSGTEILSLSLQHEATAINLGVFGQDDINLSALQLATSGTMQELTLSGKVNVQANDFEPAALTFSAVYMPEYITLESVAINSEEISADVTGSYVLASQTLDLDWVLSNLTLERYLSGMEVNGVSGAGHLELSTDESGIDASLELGPLQGELNSYPLSIRGSMQVNDSALTNLDLTASNADNRLQVNGALVPELALDWQFDAPQLQQLWTDLTGTVEGSGTLTGTTDAPMLTGDLQGQSLVLSLNDSVYRLRAFEANAASDTRSNSIVLNLHDLVMQSEGTQQEVIQNAVLVLEGTPQSHTLSADMQGMDSSLQLNLQGSGDSESWSGEFSSVRLQSPFGAWELQEQTRVQVNATGFEVSRHCWAMEAMRLCGQASQLADTGLNAQLDLSAFPLAWLNTGTDKPQALQDWQNTLGLILPQGVQISGTVDANAEIAGYDSGDWQSLQASLQPHDLALQVQRQEENDQQTLAPEFQHLNFSDVQLSLSEQNDMWNSHAAFDVSSGGDSSALQGTFSADLGMDRNEALEGSMALNFGNLSWLEAVLPMLQEAGGSLTGNAVIAGTRTEPIINAELRVAGGRFKLPDYGLDIRDLVARLNSTGEQADLQMSAVSGEGRLELQAAVLRPMEDDREVTASINGQNFTLLATDAATVSISPDLDISLNASELLVSGRLTIPSANLELEELLADVESGAVNTSRDVVILEEDPQALVAEQSGQLPLNARLTLVLGDDVRLSGYGLEAELTGELTMEQDEQHPLLAYGELAIPSGTYRFYNQELNARDGRLLFYGNPFNPVLDVKAYRETSTAEVGMQLSGSLNRIQGTPYSTPSMPDNEILALLITGKSFNNMNDEDGSAVISAIAGFGIERGEGLTSRISDTLGLDNLAIDSGDTYRNSSLGLGKYLTPDLLMRYEIGLFDRAAVLSIEYTLTEHVKLEVKTGLSQSVDLSYTIEKD